MPLAREVSTPAQPRSWGQRWLLTKTGVPQSRSHASPPRGDVTSWGADLALTLLSTIWKPFGPPDVVRGGLGFV